MITVSLVVIATGKYDRFLTPLITSARTHLEGLGSIFVLSDQAIETDDDGVRWLPWGHTQWPYSSLLRYRAITAYRELLGEADILLHSDVDMRFVSGVKLPHEGLFAVAHPGYVGASRSDFPYETNPKSQAFVAPDRGEHYVAGAVQGGASGEYLNACAELADDIQCDLDNGVVPVWHDESMWNRFCIDHGEVTVLSSDYCTPESALCDSTIMIALDKHHSLLRQSTLRVELELAIRERAGWLIRLLRPIVHLIRRVTSQISGSTAR
jgi:histo-blood group ABO system transferase